MTPVTSSASTTTSAATAATTTIAVAAAAADATLLLSNDYSSLFLVLHVSGLAGHADQPSFGQDASRQTPPVDTPRVEPHRLVEHLQSPRGVMAEKHRFGARPFPD